MNRRHLLAGLPALSLSPLALSALPARAARVQPYQKIGVQLYTVRQAFGADPLATLARLRAIGYDYVEPVSFGGLTPAVLKSALTQAGLTAPSAHIGLNDWKSRPEAALDDVAALGARIVVLAWLPEEARKDWKGLAKQMNLWAQMAHERGLGFAYHNHDFEFTRSTEGLPYHLLLENTDPKTVAFELDCYWASLAGRDPLHVLQEHGDRIRLLHLKDKTAGGDMAPVGEGVIDFSAILTKAKALGIEYVYVEHDNPTDPFASLTTSLKNLKG